MNKLLARSLLILSLISFFSACKKNEDDPIAPATGKITAQKTTVRPLEVVMLGTENMQLNATAYQGTFGGQPVQLSISENKLVFMVPKLGKGSYPFETKVEGVSFSAVYVIDSVSSISNADQYIQKNVPIYTLSDTLLDKITAATAGMGDPVNDQTNAQILRQYRDDFKAEIAKATPEARSEFASFVWANPLLFQSFEDVTSAIDSFNVARLAGGANSPESMLKNLHYALNSRIADLITLTMVYSAINTVTITIPGVNYIVAVATAGDLMYVMWSLNKWLEIQFDKSILAFTQPDLFSVTRGNYDFDKDQPYTFVAKMNYRNMNQTDVGSSSPIITSLVGDLNTYENKWNSLMNLVTKPLKGNSFHIKNVTKVKSKNRVVNADYLAIEIMNNNAVDVKIADTDGFVGTFTSNAQTDQNFSFRVYYDFEQINDVYTTYDGILHVNPIDCSSLKVSATRNGKTVTATATGGKAPYQYSFQNYAASQSFSITNTFNLVYDGYFRVIVKDANGCLDTAKGCVNDVVINTFQMAPSSPTGIPNGILTLSYTSSLGLIPEFLKYFSGTSSYSLMGYIVTGGNSPNYPSNIDDYCTNDSYGGLSPKAYSISGDAFNRTMKFTFSNYTQPVGASLIKLRLLNMCNGINVCNGNPSRTILFGPEYTLAW